MMDVFKRFHGSSYRIFYRFLFALLLVPPFIYYIYSIIYLCFVLTPVIYILYIFQRLPLLCPYFRHLLATRPQGTTLSVDKRTISEELFQTLNDITHPESDLLMNITFKPKTCLRTAVAPPF